MALVAYSRLADMRVPGADTFDGVPLGGSGAGTGFVGAAILVGVGDQVSSPGAGAVTASNAWPLAIRQVMP